MRVLYLEDQLCDQLEAALSAAGLDQFASSSMLTNDHNPVIFSIVNDRPHTPAPSAFQLLIRERARQWEAWGDESARLSGQYEAAMPEFAAQLMVSACFWADGARMLLEGIRCTDPRKTS